MTVYLHQPHEETNDDTMTNGKYGQPCSASKNFDKNNIHIQCQKLNGSNLKYGKLV